MDRRSVLVVCAAWLLMGATALGDDPVAPASGTLAGVVAWNEPLPDSRYLHGGEYSCGVDLAPGTWADGSQLVARCAIEPPEGAEVRVAWNLETREWRVVSITFSLELN
ncbi:MAG: hypothetical protein WD069_02895 [Planctomycetales bacterium]